jgi:hypothetical protein
MTDSLPTPDDRAPDRRDEMPAAPGDSDDQNHEEQPGFPEGPISPAEGGD